MQTKNQKKNKKIKKRNIKSKRQKVKENFFNGNSIQHFFLSHNFPCLLRFH